MSSNSNPPAAYGAPQSAQQAAYGKMQNFTQGVQQPSTLNPDGTPAVTNFNANGTTAAPVTTQQQQQQIGDWLHGGAAPGAATAQNNYIGSAQAQAQQSQQNTQAQTQANRPNQFTPFNSSQWTQNPDGSWTQKTNLAPGLQNALFSLQGQAAANAGQPFDNGSAARQQAIDAAYNQSASRLDPRFNQAQEQLQTQLANQGLDPNSAAYRNAMQQFGQQRNDAYQGAMNSAIGQGTAAQQATFGENLAAQMAPYQQMQSLFGLGGAPSFMGANRADPAQLLAAMTASGNYALGQQDQSNQLLGSGLGMAGNAIGAGAALALSDERTKQNIQRLPMEAIPGVPLASFEYRHQPGHKYVGVIAQDLERVAPDQVTDGPDGLKRVAAPFAPFSFGGNK